ncbi:MAG: hypothetical protein SOW59_04895 [Corynebacterium sp.]|nr:hypothetical protein [Corynebacterium sp.]
MTIVGIGNLADRLGCLRVLTFGSLLNIVGSILLATSGGAFTEFMVISARILQGLSGAAIMAASLGLVSMLWTGNRWSRALSLWSITSPNNSRWGIYEGAKANLIVVAAPSQREALQQGSGIMHSIHNGKLVFSREQAPIKWTI